MRTRPAVALVSPRNLTAREIGDTILNDFERFGISDKLAGYCVGPTFWTKAKCFPRFLPRWTDAPTSIKKDPEFRILI